MLFIIPVSLPQILLNGDSKLIGAGILALARDTFQLFHKLLGRRTLRKRSNTPEVSFTAALEFDVVNTPVFKLEFDLPRAYSLGLEFYAFLHRRSPFRV